MEPGSDGASGTVSCFLYSQQLVLWTLYIFAHGARWTVFFFFFFFFFFFSTWFCGHSISLYTKRVWVWSLLLLLFSAVGSVDTAYLCDCSPPLLEEQVAKYTINLFCTSEAPDSSPPPLAVLCNEKYFNQVIE